MSRAANGTGRSIAAMKLSATLLAFGLAACAHAPPMDSTASLAAAEAAFAAHSMREDMRAAFLAAFADDGMFVRGGWNVSNDYLRPRPAPAIALDWRPQYVEVAASGDLGLSTGPSKIVSKAQPGAAPAYGQFVSVWRREAGGPWKVAVDLGIGHPQDSLWNAPLETRQLSAVAGAPGGDGIAQAEARFARASAERGARAAYAALGADRLRYYRPGHAPVANRAAALASAAMTDERHAWTIERIETARSGDFGYARGAYSGAGGTQPLGWYLRVWRREPGGWRIVMDVTNPAPR